MIVLKSLRSTKSCALRTSKISTQIVTVSQYAIRPREKNQIELNAFVAWTVAQSSGECIGHQNHPG